MGTDDVLVFMRSPQVLDFAFACVTMSPLGFEPSSLHDLSCVIILVGPVGFEPTTSGPKASHFLGTPAPQVHRAHTRSGILLAESCSQTKLSRELQRKPLLDDGPTKRKNN